MPTLSQPGFPRCILNLLHDRLGVFFFLNWIGCRRPELHFGLGSTLSGMTYLERVRRMKELGYSVEIIFLGPRSPGLAIKRMAHRVKQRGHQVSAEDVRRRFERGWSDL